MRTYTEQELKKLGIPFYEDAIKVIKNYIKNNRFHYIPVEDIEPYDPEYERYAHACSFYENIKKLKGPMEINDIFNYMINCR